MSAVVHILFFMGGKNYVSRGEEHLCRDRKFTNICLGVHMTVEVVHIAEFILRSSHALLYFIQKNRNREITLSTSDAQCMQH